MTPRRARTWRWVVFAALSLAAGLVATVVTAVLCTNIEPGLRGKAGVVGEEQGTCAITYLRGPGHSRAAMYFGSGRNSARAAAKAMRHRIVNQWPNEEGEAMLVPRWCLAMVTEGESLRKNAGLTQMVGFSYAVGWPLHCLYGGSFDFAGSSSMSAGARTKIGIRQVGTRVIPTRPLPIPLALNTLFFATVLGSLSLLAARGVRSLRRARRARRGACIRCGYDLRGLGGGGVCPECGAAAAAPPTPTAT